MPSAAEVLKQLVAGQQQILDQLGRMDSRITALESRPAEDSWLEEEIDLPSDPDVVPVRVTSVDHPEPASVDEDAGVVEITPPTRTQRKFREKWLPRIGLENLPTEWGLSKEEADAAYVEGGPVWLYLAGAGFTEEQKSGRDYILSLPEDVRRAMVNDLQLGEISPRWIQEFGRDILKDEGDSRRAAEVFAEATAGGYRMPGVG